MAELDNILFNGNNLYRTGAIIQLDTDYLLYRDKLEYVATEEDAYHTFKEGDELDKIAYDRYNSKVGDASKYWWIIADVNSIDNPLDVESLIGSELLIPDILKVLLQLQ